MTGRTAIALVLALLVHTMVLLLHEPCPPGRRSDGPVVMEIRGPAAPQPASSAAPDRPRPPLTPRRSLAARGSGKPAAPATVATPPPGPAPTLPAEMLPGKGGEAAPAALPAAGGLHCPSWAPCASPQTGSSAPGSSPGPDLRARILQQIAAHRHYPELARRRGIEGTVALRFRVGADGRAQDLEVIHSAHPWLDEAARQAVIRAAPLPPVDGPQIVTIEFHLHDGQVQ
ncbi:MAG: energy transducer TonB [Myxococcales bacterium]|nr:energy transducer TonB [Myxococcota bacterium]MDW8281606.1 energy transducer TonB [Myxococcales bacterium]